MSIGRILTLGVGSFGSSEYVLTLGLGDLDDVVVVDIDSERFTLIGASGKRYAINGTSTARINAIGATEKRHTFTGAVR